MNGTEDNLLKIVRVFLLTVTLLAMLVIPVAAAPVSYIFKGSIEGTLGGTSVSGLLTLTATGDTNDVMTADGLLFGNGQLTSVFELAGVGSFAILNGSYVVVNQTTSGVGFGVEGVVHCCEIIQNFVDPTYATYDLKTSIGPIAAPENPILQNFLDIPTTSGSFTVTRMTENSFQAIVSAVPEPGSFVLLASGIAGVWTLRRRRS